MATLQDKIDSLNTLKTTLLQMLNNKCTECRCNDYETQRRLLSRLNEQVDITKIENVISLQQGTCTYCGTLTQTQAAYDDAKTAVYDAIVSEYSLTPETNPFLI